MCKDGNTIAFRLESRKSSWRLAVPVEGEQPQVEVSGLAIRFQLPDQSVATYQVPTEAQPLVVEKAKCSFSTKRRELFIDWPQSDPADATPFLSADVKTSPSADVKPSPSDAETTASESEAESDAKLVGQEAPADNNPGAKTGVEGPTDASEDNIMEHAADLADNSPAQTEAEAKVTSVETVSATPATSSAATDSNCNNQGAAAALEETPAAEQVACDSAVATHDAEEWRTMGNAAVKTGNMEEAIRCYSSGLALGGGDRALLHSNRALCFCQLGRHEEGFEDARQCVSLRPDFFKGYVRGAKALRELGCAEEALTFLKKCPKNDEAAALAAELKPEAEAAEAARIASLSGPERAKEEGNVLFRKGLFETALVKYSEALEGCADPESATALAIRNNRAACYHQLSDYSSVVADTNYVLQKEPSNFKALFRRMLALEPLERYQAALEDARALLQQDPRNDVANKVQHRLSKLVRDLQREARA
jgi:tetratricopeptide (TPR) repeat protein